MPGACCLNKLTELTACCLNTLYHLSCSGGDLTPAVWARQVLATLHMQATRVVPLKLSAKLAHDAHKRHDYDENADLEDPTTWRYFSLTATWERLMHHISHDVDMEDGDFACIFEDDVALHDDVSHATARKAILRSMDLARSDGLVYFGSCYAGCDLKSAVEWVSNVRLEKCINLCTHAMAVTKRKAATLMAELHDEVRADFEQHNYHSIHLGYVIDQMLKVYQRRRNGMWTVGTNLWSAQDKYNMSIGAFFQDRWRVKSSIGGQQ